MRSANNPNPISVVVLILFLSVTVTAKTEVVPNDAAGKLLLDRIGNFRATGSAHPTGAIDVLNEFNVTGDAERTYVSVKGERLLISITTAASDASAYALFTRNVESMGAVQTAEAVDVGTASYVYPNRLLFFRGRAYVEVRTNTEKLQKNSEALIELARSFSATLDKSEGEIPVLVKHLPDWQKVRSRSLYAVSLATLKGFVPNQPVIDVLNFAGGVEAAAANYGPAQLVVVEFNTPQLASDNDARINAKLQELRNQGQAGPTAYRRVGNYSVFVFNAPDEQTAGKLIDQVKYEQVVQWLGPNPNIEAALVAAEKDFVDTTLGVFVSVVKASGLAILITFGIGGCFGAVLFRWRRSRRAATEAYSDAGGMLRLNIDEMTAQTDPARLLGPGN